MKILILTAMREEAKILCNAMGLRETGSIHNTMMYGGTCEGHTIVLAQMRLGKVAAAMATTMSIQRERPDIVINTGIAGNARPSCYGIGDVIIARCVCQHDVYVPFDGDHLSYIRDVYTRIYPTYIADAIHNMCAANVHSVRPGTSSPCVLATGDQFVDNEARVQDIAHQYDADCIDMEGAAIASVCASVFAPGAHHTDACLPLVIIKGISDNADANAPTDHEDNLARAMQACHRCVMRLITTIA